MKFRHRASLIMLIILTFDPFGALGLLLNRPIPGIVYCFWLYLGLLFNCFWPRLVLFFNFMLTLDLASSFPIKYKNHVLYLLSDINRAANSNL